MKKRKRPRESLERLFEVYMIFLSLHFINCKSAFFYSPFFINNSLHRARPNKMAFSEQFEQLSTKTA
jgi:hypothetical protein